MRRDSRSILRVGSTAGLLGLSWVLLVVDVARAQIPVLPTARLTTIYPPGAQQGTSVDVTTAGLDLDDATRLLFAHPGITSEPITAPLSAVEPTLVPVPGQFKVSVAADVPPGVYEVRAVGKYGISNPRDFTVGQVVEAVEVEGNNTPTDAKELPLGTALSGRCDGATDVDYYKIVAQAGQRIVVDCWAERIDSRLDATLSLVDAAGQEFATARSAHRHDPLLDYTVAAAGDYYLKLYDSSYSGGPEYYYRLAVSAGPHIDFAVPAAGLPGTTARVTLYGRNLPGGTPAPGVSVDGRPLEQLAVDVTVPTDPLQQQPLSGTLITGDGGDLRAFDFRLAGPQGASNPYPIEIAAGPLVVEQEGNDAAAQAQLVTLPCDVAGNFGRRGDQDWVAFDAKAGETWWVECASSRRGLPTDPHLVVYRTSVDDQGAEKLNELTEADDLSLNLNQFTFSTISTDFAIGVSIPEDGRYKLALRDLFDTGDPRNVYRLSIRPPAPGFELLAVPRFPAPPGQVLGAVWSLLLRKGGAEAVDVHAFRHDGYTGPIDIAVEGLPAGVTAQPVTIGPGLSSTTLVLSATDAAAEWTGEIRIVGKAAITGQDVIRQARSADVVWDSMQQGLPATQRLSRGLMLAVSAAEVFSFSVDAGQGQVWETSLAGTLNIPVRITKRGDFAAAVGLTPVSLVPGLNVPAININPDQAEVPLQVQVPTNVPVGTYTFFLAGTTQVNYSRNPEAAKAAADRQLALDALVTESTTAQQTADAEKNRTATAAQEAANLAKQAADAKTAADAALVQAQQELATAEQAAAAAQTALDGDANNQTLKDAKAAADQVVVDAKAKVATAEQTKATADKAAEDTALAAKTAEETRVAAEQAATEAAQKLQQAQQVQQQAAQLAQQLAQASAVQAINVTVPSTPVTIRITASPITIEAPAPTSALKQGQQIELPVNIARLYGYADVVDLELVVPGGVAGLSIPTVNVPGDQAQGKLVVQAAADATVGTHTLTLKATARINGQPLPVEQPVMLTVEAVQQ
jgi:hypothetical protein